MRLTILLDDKNFNPALESEHGLSIFIEGKSSTFIFDCGQTGIAWKNAAMLGVDLKKINFAVISHAHYDHAGGFPTLIKYVTPKILYTGINFWQEKFSRADDNFAYKGAGFTADDLKRWNVEHKICRDTIQVDEEIFIVGNFERRTDFETIPEKFVRGENKLPDTFDDEICLVMRGVEGLSVVVGCSHGIIGGIHLINSDSKRIEKTLTALKSFGVRDFKLCHCSGIDTEIYTGSVIEI